MLISVPSPYLICLFLLPCFLHSSPLTIPEKHLHPADLHKRVTIHCLAEYQSGIDQLLHSINYADCFEVVRQQILCGDKSQAPMDFSRVRGFTVPYRWAHGTCAILVDVDGDDHTTEVDTLAHVAEAVIEIVETCARHSTNISFFYGGRTAIGPHNKLKVGIMGQAAQEERPQRHTPGMCMVGIGSGGF